MHDLARLGPEHCGSGRRHFGTETGCGGGKSGKRGLFKVPKTSSRKINVKKKKKRKHYAAINKAFEEKIELE